MLAEPPSLCQADRAPHLLRSLARPTFLGPLGGIGYTTCQRTAQSQSLTQHMTASSCEQAPWSSPMKHTASLKQGSYHGARWYAREHWDAQRKTSSLQTHGADPYSTQHTKTTRQGPQDLSPPTMQ